LLAQRIYSSPVSYSVGGLNVVLRRPDPG